MHPADRAGVAGAAGGGDLRRSPRSGARLGAVERAAQRGSGRRCDSGSMAGRHRASMSGGRRSATRWSSRLRASPMWKSAPSGVGDLLAEERADRAAGDPPHELALQVALGDRVVARSTCPAPTTAPGVASWAVTARSRRGPRPRWPGRSRTARRVAHHVADEHAVLAVGGELGPVRAHRRRRGRAWPRSASIRTQVAAIVLVVE